MYLSIICFYDYNWTSNCLFFSVRLWLAFSRALILWTILLASKVFWVLSELRMLISFWKLLVKSDVAWSIIDITSMCFKASRTSLSKYMEASESEISSSNSLSIWFSSKFIWSLPETSGAYWVALKTTLPILGF